MSSLRQENALKYTHSPGLPAIETRSPAFSRFGIFVVQFDLSVPSQTPPLSIKTVSEANGIETHFNSTSPPVLVVCQFQFLSDLDISLEFPTMSNTITATVRYVHRDNKRPENEKPYILQYTTPTGFPANNFEINPVPGIKIRNFRTANLSYEDHGIKVATIDSRKMQPENFDDDDWIEKEYLPELHQCVCEALGAQDVTIFDWLLRKRSPTFPLRENRDKNEEAIQPSLSAHIGICAFDWF